MRLAFDLHYSIGERAMHSQLATAHDRIAIVGPSGIGKTTLLRALLGLAPARGAITLDGVAIDALAAPARRFGWVPQDAALFPHLDVYGNLAFASVEKPLERIAEALGLTDRLFADVATLSGGEKQRVAIGRALASRPRSIVLDEPLSALDRAARREVAAVIERERRGAMLLLASHDDTDVAALADEVYAMREGGTLTRVTPPTSPG